MTWTFEAELEAHRNGWIDYHGFVSAYQKGWLKPALEKVRSVQEFEGYRPYFNPENEAQKVTFSYRPPTTYFGVGRVSRDDAGKYSHDMWNIFYKVCTPIPKKVFVLGYGSNAHERCGSAPAGLDWQIWMPNGITASQLLERIHCLIHKTGGSRESYCRVVVEAYASGAPVVVEDDFAFPELVEDGVTGFRCRSSDEMSFRASELAFDEPRREQMILAARRFLVEEIASADRCWQAWRRFLDE